ncbi:unnamed protein product, partial [Allacma fusca]
SKLSTSDAIYELVNTISDMLQKNEKPIGIFCDLSKAFDRIRHNILVAKLEHYGIRGIAKKLIKSYLANRTQRVKLVSKEGITISDPENVTMGVPQGSNLGPYFFLIYVNDFPHCTKNKTIQFADDTTAITKGISWTLAFEEAEKTLQEMQTWFMISAVLAPSKLAKIPHSLAL